jgi:hypothetical protein
MLGKLLAGDSLARLQEFQNGEYPHRRVIHLFYIPTKDDKSCRVLPVG